MKRLKIGIAGCGEVTQVIHLPAFEHLSTFFEVTALCDVSSQVLAGVAPRAPNARHYNDYEDMVRDANVDAVLVASPHAYHAPTAIAALRAGKHVFIEKPVAMTLADADRIAAAEKESGRIVQVGYMRRYAGAFLAAVEAVRKERDQIRFARVHDFIGANRIVIDDTSAVVRGADISDAAKADHSHLQDLMSFDAIGTKDPALVQAYALLLGLSSHDISAMRELLGPPLRVLYAAQRIGGLNISAAFDYGNFICSFATGVDRLPRFDAFIEVYGPNSVLRIDYDTPYVRNVPARLTVTRPAGEAGVETTTSFPSRLDAFVVEWRAFHQHVTTGSVPKTTVADARQDLEIFGEIMTHLGAPGPADTASVAA